MVAQSTWKLVLFIGSISLFKDATAISAVQSILTANATATRGQFFARSRCLTAVL